MITNHGLFCLDKRMSEEPSAKSPKLESLKTPPQNEVSNVDEPEPSESLTIGKFTDDSMEADHIQEATQPATLSGSPDTMA